APSSDEYRGRFPELVSDGRVQAVLVQEVPKCRQDPRPLPEDANASPSAKGDTLCGDIQARKDSDPARIGRFLITGKLGSGSFGVVYKGFDPDLQRDVAIKVAHLDRLTRPEDAEVYQAEARMLARLDHPGIVPIYEVGRTDEGLCY